MVDTDKNLLLGFIVGIAITLFFWWLIADEIEKRKVSSGYLTYRHKTYQVTLYDTLDKPVKDKPNETKTKTNSR